MRALHRTRPDVHIALLIEAAIERERVRFLPGLHHQVMRFEIALAQQAWVLAIAIAGVHRRADREAGDQPPARDHVDHRELFSDARRRIVESKRIAHHADRGIPCAPRQCRRDQVGRRHKAVAVGVVLVAAHGIEAAVGRELHLVHEVVVHQVRALWVEQRRMDVDPHRRMLLPEVLRQFGVRHQMEPQEFHGGPIVAGARLAIPASMAAKPLVRQPPGFSGPVALQPGPAAGRLLRPAARHPRRLARRWWHVLPRLPDPVAAAR